MLDSSHFRDPPAASELVPPPRFAQATFAGYRLDPGVAGQAVAVAAVKSFAAGQGGWRAWFGGGPRGLYLDGGFGVGKTHLLAAAFHASGGSRRHLAFSEAMGLMALLGHTATASLLAADLVCIDEFELDDPANVRLADLLLRLLIERGCRVLATSNTVPGELGHGRMAVDQFRNVLSRIAERFTSVHVPGPDHRAVRLPPGSAPPGWALGTGEAAAAPAAWPRFTARALDSLLTDVPLPSLRRLASALPGLAIAGAEPFTDPLAALRFVHLVDRLYEWNVPLRVGARCPIGALFPAHHCLAAFAKKHRRCESRLIEMCATA